MFKQEGILNRPLKQDHGRNKSSLDTQFQKDLMKADTKKLQLTNIHEHRRAAFDGSRTEKHQLQQHQKKEIDFLNDAKSSFEERKKKLNEFEDTKNYKHFLEAKRREDQARAAKREYERQLINQNKQMIQEKVERQAFDKEFSNLKEREMIKVDFNKKSSDYR